VLEAHVERDGAFGETERRFRPQRVAARGEDAAPADRHGDAAAALDPELVSSRLRNAQLARPAQLDATAEPEAGEVAARDLDAAGRGASGQLGPAPHLGREAGGPACGHEHPERGERRGERDREGGCGARAARAPDESGEDREGDERDRERQRARVDRGLGGDGGPARHGEHDEAERRGEGRARAEREESQQARAFYGR
jgi:hypothetical protein